MLLWLQVKLINVRIKNNEGLSVYLTAVALLHFLWTPWVLPNSLGTISPNAMYTENAFMSEWQDILSDDTGHQCAIYRAAIAPDLLTVGGNKRSIFFISYWTNDCIISRLVSDDVILLITSKGSSHVSSTNNFIYPIWHSPWNSSDAVTAFINEV